MRLLNSAGFTLIELMVSITIIMILSGIILANLSGAGARGRDLDRQSDLRALQSAIEEYKRDHGRYPAMGCTPNAENFSSETDCTNYIVGHTAGVNFVPDYIDRLPRDPRIESGEQGYSYITNETGSVYKIMAMRTVESEQVTYSHPMKSCAINPSASGGFPGGSTNPDYNLINTQGWCRFVDYSDLDGNTVTNYVPDCIWQGTAPIAGNGRFDTSYGLWGGFEPLSGSGLIRQQVGPTTRIICE